jgi:hypothetical protein
MKIGDKFYFMTHAYHHFLGEIADMPMPKTVILKDVVRVQSCARGWTEFFRDGAKNDTTMTHWPDGTEVCGWFTAVPWVHDIPKPGSNPAPANDQ